MRSLVGVMLRIPTSPHFQWRGLPHIAPVIQRAYIVLETSEYESYTHVNNLEIFSEYEVLCGCVLYNLEA